jgi:hypothetical protein
MYSRGPLALFPLPLSHMISYPSPDIVLSADIILSLHRIFQTLQAGHSTKSCSLGDHALIFWITDDYVMGSWFYEAWVPNSWIWLSSSVDTESTEDSSPWLRNLDWKLDGFSEFNAISPDISSLFEGAFHKEVKVETVVLVTVLSTTGKILWNWNFLRFFPLYFSYTKKRIFLQF